MANPEYPPLREPVLGADGLFTPAWQRYFTQSLIPYLERVDSAEINNFTTTSNEQQGMFLQAIEDLRGFFLGSMPLASNELLQRIEVLEMGPFAEPGIRPKGVYADANIADHAIVRGDGGIDVVQSSSASVDDNGKVSAIGALIGDGLSDYIDIDDDGQLTLYGLARFYEHIRVGASSWKLGVAGPAEGYEGILATLDFDAASDDEVYYNLLIPNGFETGSNMSVKVDWCYSGAADAGTVCWAMEFILIDEGETVDGTTTTIAICSPGSHTSGKLVRTTFASQIRFAVAHEVLGVRLYRDVSADTLAADAKLIQVHFEFLQNTFGQNLITGEMWGANMWGANMWGANMWSQAS